MATFAFTEVDTVDTTEDWTATDAVWASRAGLWVLAGFRSPANVAGVQTSADGGLTWTMHDWPSTASRRAVAYAPDLGTGMGRLVAVGNGVADWSDDGGVTWSAATLLPETNPWNDVQWWPALEMFIAVSASGVNRSMTSTDGKTWTAVAAAAAKVWAGLAVSATVAVAVAFDASTGTQQVMTTTDGVTWNLQTHTAIATNRGLVGGAANRLSVGYSAALNQFLITGTDAGNITKAYRSTDDGVTWTASDTIPTISNTTNRGYLWIDHVGWYMPCANANYGLSENGIQWTITAISGPSNTGYTPLAWDEQSALVDENRVATLIGGSTLGFDTALIVTASIPVTVTRVVPRAGTTAGGTAVTIRGTGFLAFATGGVEFDGDAATNVVIVSDTAITCTTPVHASGAVDVEVLGVATGADLYTYTLTPELLPRIPDNAPVLAGRSELITQGWVQWLTAVKTRIEQPAELAAEQLHGVIGLEQVPQLPLSRLTVEESPRLVGRYSAGDGAAEEIRLGAMLTLANGILGIKGLPSGFTIGDLLYADSMNSLALLNDVSAGSYLRSGGVATAPLWSTLKLPNAATTGDLIYGSASNVLTARAIGSAGDVLTVSGGLPVWAATSGLGTGDLTRVNDTNVTLTLGGAPTDALFKDVSITAGWTGTLAVSRGGSGTGTAFTLGSIVFAGASGVYTEDNANWFYDATNKRVGIGTATPGYQLHVYNTGATSARAEVEATHTSALSIVQALHSTTNVHASIIAYGSAAAGTTDGIANAGATVVLLRSSGTAPGIISAGSGTGGLIFGAAGAGQLYINADTTMGFGGAPTAAQWHFIHDANATSKILVDNPTDGTTSLAAVQSHIGDPATGGYTSIQSVGNNYNVGGSYVNSWVGGGVLRADGGNANGLFIVGDNSITFMTLPGPNTARMKIDATTGIVAIGTTTFPGTGSAGLVFGDDTALASMGSNTAGDYADDVGGTVERFCINEAGALARLTGIACRNSAQFDKTTDTTLANVTGLTRNVAAGVAYRFEAVLFVTADATGGSKFAIAGTATATAILYDVILLDEGTDAYTIVSRQTALAGSAGQAGTTSGICRIVGTIVVNAAGTLTVQFAQNASNGTSSILANSSFEMQQVA